MSIRSLPLYLGVGLHLVGLVLIWGLELPFALVDLAIVFSLSPLVMILHLSEPEYPVFKRSLLVTSSVLSFCFFVLAISKIGAGISFLSGISFFTGHTILMAILRKISRYLSLGKKSFLFFNLQLIIVFVPIVLDDALIAWYLNPSLWLSYGVLCLASLL